VPSPHHPAMQDLRHRVGQPDVLSWHIDIF
jgi:hypothetical protein